MRLIRVPEVLERTALSRSTLYELIERGAFSRPVKVSARCVAWPEHEVEAFIKARIAEREAA